MKRTAPLFVAAAAVLWGILFIFVRQLNAGGLGAMEVVCIRVCGSAAMLLLASPLFRFITGRRDTLRIRLKDSWCFLGTGVFSIVFFSYCYFRNVGISSAAVSSILMYTSPVWVTLLSAACFKERVTGRKVFALILALGGCILVSGVLGGGLQVSPLGLLLGLGSGIGYGLYSIFGRFALDKGYHPVTVTTYTFLFACVGVQPFVSVSSIYNKFLAKPELLLWAFCIAFFSTCLSFTLYTVGLKDMEPGKAAVLATLEPIVSTVTGVVFYKEEMSPVMLLGILLVLTASVMISAQGKRK